MLLQVSRRFVVHRENTVLGPRLDGHVADSEAVVHLQRGNAVAGKLQGLVERAIHPDEADEVEDHVLARDVGGQLARQLHPDGRGTLNHRRPVAIPAAMSVEPTPVENAPSAP